MASTFTEPDDPPTSAQVLQEGAAEIRDDRAARRDRRRLGALADGLEQIAAAFAGVDVNDPAAQQALGRKVAELQGPLGTASTNVENYLRDECGIGSASRRPRPADPSRPRDSDGPPSSPIWRAVAVGRCRGGQPPQPPR